MDCGVKPGNDSECGVAHRLSFVMPAQVPDSPLVPAKAGIQ